jgi:WD40 repeat protein
LRESHFADDLSEENRRLALLLWEPGAIIFLAMTINGPDGRVVTASADNTARLWDAVAGTEAAVLKGHTDKVNTARRSRSAPAGR